MDSLLSCDTARGLDLINLNVNAVKSDGTQSHVTNLNQLLDTHDDIFNGIGKLKTHQIKIHINESTPGEYHFTHVKNMRKPWINWNNKTIL